MIENNLAAVISDLRDNRFLDLCNALTQKQITRHSGCRKVSTEAVVHSLRWQAYGHDRALAQLFFQAAIGLGVIRVSLAELHAGIWKTRMALKLKFHTCSAD